MALRRVHAFLLSLPAALLVLLLLAPRPPPPPRPAPLAPLAPLALSVSLSRPPPVPLAASASASTAPSPPVAPSVAPSPSPSPPVAPRDPRVLMTRDVYVGGHPAPHAALCPALGARLRLLVLVSSAPEHRRARDAIRLTWGHYAARADVALAFFVGAAPSARRSLEAELAAEDALYGDLVRGAFLDSYSNLTLKTISMLEWTATYCARAPRLLKTDDDMFINVPRLLAFAASPRVANASRAVFGRLVRRSLPKRTPRSKYYVSPLQFPARVLPDFCTGPAYLLAGDAVAPLWRAALEPSERYVRLEDVFVTGVLAARLGLVRTHVPEFYNRKVPAHACSVRRALAIHMVRFHEQFDLWRKLHDERVRCS